MTKCLSLPLIVCTIAAAGCDDDDTPPAGVDAAAIDAAGVEAAATEAPAGDRASSGAGAQTPPQGQAAMQAWIAEGHYKTWRCETAISSPRPNGAHGRNRVCTNDVLSATTAGANPVGSASVKEIYGAGDTPTGHAVSLKVAAGATGASWYWYERLGTSVVADGINVGSCAGCHASAGQAGRMGRDFVYIQAK